MWVLVCILYLNDSSYPVSTIYNNLKTCTQRSPVVVIIIFTYNNYVIKYCFLDKRQILLFAYLNMSAIYFVLFNALLCRKNPCIPITSSNPHR